MERSFLQNYLNAFHRIEGWFSFDAALLFMAYNQLAADRREAGPVLEIGVHHGLSTIATAALRGPGHRLIAIDLFETLQDKNVSRSGSGDRATFEQNMREFYPDPEFVTILARPSSELRPADLGSGFTFCHIDGGHSPLETHADLSLCSAISAPGGLIALDDYFNPTFPGVCEGAVQFMLERKGDLTPLAIGFNKVIFQKTPAPADLNRRFSEAFPAVPHGTSEMWGASAITLGQPLRHFIDLHASTPSRLVPLGSIPARANLRPSTDRLKATCGSTVLLPVAITNTFHSEFPAGSGVFGLSWHLLSASGEMLVHDNDRVWITKPLQPGERLAVELPVQAPKRAGRYRLEIDLVWENNMWFKDVGNPAPVVELSVS